MKSLSIVVLTLTAALFLAAPLRAITFETPDTRIGSSATVSGDDFALAADGTGKVYAAWLDYRTGTDQVFFNYSADHGQTWQGTDTQVSFNPHSGAYAVKMAAGGSNVYLIWEEDMFSWAPQTTERINTMFASSNDYGANWSAPTNIAANPNSDQYRANVAAGSGNNVYVIWQDFINYAINFRRSTDGGATWLPVRELAADYKTYPVIFANTAGNVYAGWQENYNEKGWFHFIRSDDNGATFFNIQTINGDSVPPSARYCALGGDATNVYAFWYNQTLDHDFRFNSSSDNGSNWGANDKLLSSDAEFKTGGSLRHDNDASGNVYAAWIQRNSLGGPNVVKFNCSNDAGATWKGTEATLTSFTSGNARVCAISGGAVAVVYQDQASFTDESGYPQDTLLCAFSEDAGGTFAGAVRVDGSSQTPERDQRYPAIAADGSYLYAGWRERRSGDYGLYFNRASLGGAAPTPTPVPPPSAAPWITDYNGDGTSDVAIFRSSTGLWAVKGVTRVYYGSSGDSPIPADYNGNGITDIAVFRGSTGLWAVNGGPRVYFGRSGDEPLPRDYNGDGTVDIGLFRPSSGLWAVRQVTRTYFGSSADSPIPGYYGGTGAAPGIFRAASGLWAIKGITRTYFGASSDEPVPGDYSGDGSWDLGVFRSTAGLWAVKGVTRTYFGGSGDDPIPGGYKGDGKDYLGIFRGTGLWAIKGVTRVYFGSGTDEPATR